MNTPDVIQTISRATDELKALLLQQEASINDQERANERLTSRVDNLEAMLSRTREDRDNLSSALTEANKQLKVINAQYSNLSFDHEALQHEHRNVRNDFEALRAANLTNLDERDAARNELQKLKDIILNIGVAVEPIVNPPVDNPKAPAGPPESMAEVGASPLPSPSTDFTPSNPVQEPSPMTREEMAKEFDHTFGNPEAPVYDQYGNKLPPGVVRDPVTGKWATRQEHEADKTHEDEKLDTRPFKEAFGW